MVEIKQYDRVRVMALNNARFHGGEPFYGRHPVVGDIGYVVEIYADPPGYEVECCARGDGITT